MSLFVPARRFYDAGIVVVPVSSDHEKRATVKWAHFYDEGTDQTLGEALRYGREAHALGVLTGAPSKGLELIEVEAAGMHCWPRMRKAVTERCPWWADIEAGYCTKPPHGGRHFLLRAPEVLPSTSLVRNGDTTLVETRGVRGMSVEAGTIGRDLCDKCVSGACIPCDDWDETEIRDGLITYGWHSQHLHTYELLAGGPETIFSATQQQYERLHAAFQWHSSTPVAPIGRGVTAAPVRAIGPGWSAAWQSMDPTDYLQWSTEFIRTQGVGNRNQRLYGRACACFYHVLMGSLDADEVWDRLLAAALESGLERRQAEATLRSAVNRIERDHVGTP